ncbi:DUF5085 family protein [Staphylococcus edaphicus]|uniref:DUF5085 domain-containing protein n=1 Tax=Staphylococcus edaphicus TaxID=1955013 RepID=A0A2C6WKQ2_9STAP|nr:DUF5085 family protein [Staphylococcus edaphicus]PHK48733.1 DUF5085 domain-containing protein [Staphylococcus edaphicus]UQW81658.1 DUF5085 family protein [Staphylococcus edaphicus]
MNEMSYSNMMFRNVVYKEYLDFNIFELDTCAKDFYKLISEHNLKKNGPLIMAYTQVMKENMVNIELMLPVNKPLTSNENLNFRTYLCIDEMLHGRMIGEDYENQEKKVLTEIERFSKENNLKRISPYYHIINEVEGLKWIDIKVKVLEL